MSRPNYSTYIQSTEWRSRHPEFLRKSRYRCAMFPFLKVGKGARYNVHHLSYENLGDEQLWRDVVVLCPFAHTFIIHGILSGFRRPSQQRSYPNTAQKIAHTWCTVPVKVRLVFVVLLLINLVRIVLT